MIARGDQRTISDNNGLLCTTTIHPPQRRQLGSGEDTNSNIFFYLIWAWALWPLWHSRLWSFQGRDTKLERFMAKNQLSNFENWSNGELSKSTKI